jgi:NAD(P)H dehydrogenase (quinone)
MLLNDKHIGHSYHLFGEAIGQKQLAELINQVFHTKLKYKSIPVDQYEQERKKALGDFLGSVIAGIYHGIRTGINDLPSDFEKAAGRPHKSPLEMMEAFREKYKFQAR